MDERPPVLPGPVRYHRRRPGVKGKDHDVSRRHPEEMGMPV
jgi:hypothetical protein